jgi:hypothetical protein
MIEQAVALKRCASCERWSGTRTPGPGSDTVSIAGVQETGLCVGGPWDGQTRRARSACGHWTVWTMLTGCGQASVVD